MPSIATLSPALLPAVHRELADGGDGDAEVAACLSRFSPTGAALAVCAAGLGGSDLGFLVHRLSDPSVLEDGAHSPWLPFEDGAFATVLLYRVTRHDVDMELLLGEAARVLRPGGRLLLLEHGGDFAFAPLPDAGPAHLLHAWLKQAGCTDIAVTACGEAALLAQART